MKYERINWLNKGETGAKPINKTNLNKMDEAIAYLFENGGGGGGNNEPIGTIKIWAGSTAPNGYLICDGSEQSKALYPDLYSALGHKYQVSSEVFILPDLRGRVVIGAGSFDGTHTFSLHSTGGEYEHTLTIEETPEHQHNDLKITGVTTGVANGTQNSGLGLQYTNNYNSTIYTGKTGGGQAHNNIQPYIALNFIIKATATTPTQAEVEDSLDSNSTTNAPSIHAVKEAFNNLMNDTLWVNPDSTVSFGPANINFENISKYSYYEILYKNAGDKNFYFSTGKVPIDKQTILYAPVGGSLYYRECGQIVNNTIYIANAYINGNLSSPNNMALIPVKILGYYQ